MIGMHFLKSLTLTQALKESNIHLREGSLLYLEFHWQQFFFSQYFSSINSMFGNQDMLDYDVCQEKYNEPVPL